MDETHPAILPSHLISIITRRGIHFATALLLCAATAEAHRPYESDTVARFDGEALELTITTSLQIAGTLIGQPLGDPAVLESNHAQLIAEAGKAYELTVNGQIMPPNRIFFRQREEEAIFSILYPQIEPTTILFRARYLEKLPDGYSGSLEIVDNTGKLLGRHPLLKKETDTFALADPHPPAPVSTSAPPAAAIQTNPPWKHWIAGGIALALVLILLKIRLKPTAPHQKA